MGSSEDAYRKDSMNLLSNQRNDTWSNYVNVVNYQNQANAFRASASNARQQGRANRFNTILGTAASMYGIARDGGLFNGSSNSKDSFVYQPQYTGTQNYFSPSQYIGLTNRKSNNPFTLGSANKLIFR